LRVIDLYAGAGLSSIGVADADHEIVGAIELDRRAAEAFQLNHPVAEVICGRVLDYPHEWIGNVDVVICGPPCQDDSISNCKQGTRGNLKRQALKVTRQLEAKLVIMEMVPGAMAKGHHWWSNSWPRWAMRQGALAIIHLDDSRLGGYTARKRTFAVWAPEGVLVPEMKEKPPGNWGDLFPEIHAIATEANAASKRWRLEKRPGEPAPTIVSGGRALQLRVGEEKRRMTPDEQARLQGFEGLELVGSKRDQQNQVGNGWTYSFGKAWGDWLMQLEVVRGV